jgi:hypothetical protein
MDTAKKEKIKELLQLVRDSCLEGEDGTWDCSTEEGREGFIYMSDDCEKIAELLGIELEPYQKEDEENDD